MNIIKLTCVTLSQDCNVITSLQWGGENITMLWQGCDKVVTSLWQACDKHCNEVVATLWMNRQCGCKVAVGLWIPYLLDQKPRLLIFSSGNRGRPLFESGYNSWNFLPAPLFVSCYAYSTTLNLKTASKLLFFLVVAILTKVVYDTRAIT